MGTVARTAGAAGSVTITTRNSAGQLVTPVSAPVVTWYTDTGRSLGSLTLSVSGSGSTYTASWTAGQAPASPATRYLKVHIEVSTGVFDDDVDDDISFVDATSSLYPTELCSVAEVKSQLNKNLSVDDAELQDYIDAIRGPVEDYCGPILPVDLTEVHRIFGSRLVLDHPVVSITSVTIYEGITARALTAISTPASASTYCYTLEGKTIQRLGSDGYPTDFDNAVYVAYTAGYSVVPDAINLAARLLVQHMWRTQNGGAGLPALSDDELVEVEGFGMIPSKAKEFMDGYRRVSGLA